MESPFCCCSLQSFTALLLHFLVRISLITLIFVSVSACKDLQWWFSTTSLCLVSLLLSGYYSYSDSSSTVWGGWTTNNECNFVFWCQIESKLHVNILELKAVLILFQCFVLSVFQLLYSYKNRQLNCCSLHK